MGGVGVDAETILLVFLAGLGDVSFLGLLRLLDCGLIALTMLGLAGDKGGDGIFEITSNLLRKLDVEG